MLFCCEKNQTHKLLSNTQLTYSVKVVASPTSNFSTVFNILLGNKFYSHLFV